MNGSSILLSIKISYLYLENDSSLLEFKTKSKFVLTQSNMSPEARSALNLYECAVSSDDADFDSMNC